MSGQSAAAGIVLLDTDEFIGHIENSGDLWEINVGPEPGSQVSSEQAEEERGSLRTTARQGLRTVRCLPHRR